MHYLAYVESPYQLKNAVEFISRYELEGSSKIVIRKNGSSKQNEQFESLVKKECIDNVTYLNFKNSGLARYLTYPWLMLILFKYLISSDGLIVGDARSIVVKPLARLAELFKKKIILVDDGLYLFNYVYRILGKNYTLYTSLPIEERISKQKSSLKVIAQPYEQLNISKKEEESITFIGMKLPEIGFMEESVYIHYVKYIADKYSHLELNYYAHREENISKLNQIELLGFNIVKPNISIEDYFLEKGADKGIYISFYSTALANLSKMISTEEFYYIKPDIEQFPSPNRKAIIECYEYLSLLKITECKI
jgi:hypothetical protein